MGPGAKTGGHQCSVTGGCQRSPEHQTILRRHRQHSHGKPGQIMSSAQVLSLQLVAGAGSCFDRKSDIPCQVRYPSMNEIKSLNVKYRME